MAMRYVAALFIDLRIFSLFFSAACRYYAPYMTPLYCRLLRYGAELRALLR